MTPPGKVSTYQGIDGGDERKCDVRQLGVVVCSEAVVQPLVQPLPERQQHLAETLENIRPEKKIRKVVTVRVRVRVRVRVHG